MHTKFFRLGLWLFLVGAAACTTVYKPFYAPAAAGWASQMPPDSTQRQYTVFLIGDVGAPELTRQEPSLKLLEGQLRRAGEQSAVVYLGDNIYHYGMPEPGALDRKLSEERMNEQLKLLVGYPGEKYMIPGNHDWANGGPTGLAAALRQEAYVERYLADTSIVTGGNFFVPDEACPGPYEVLLNDDLLLIALNSQWWLHPFERPYGPNNRCNIANEADFLVQLEDIIRKHQDKHIVVVAHHPLASQGAHGGAYRLIDHIFPLTLLQDWAYLPLPVIGSIYPLGRMLGAVSQDIPHPKYQAYIHGVMEVFEKYDNVVYAAGHEHSLQYFRVNGVHQIVSGSGCKRQHLRRKGEALFAHEAKGFARLDYYRNGDVWLEFWEPGTGDGTTGERIYRSRIYQRENKQGPPPPPPATGISDSTRTVAANPSFMVGGLKRALLGEQYRAVWATPVTMEVLDLRNAYGGLVPYQRGSGRATASLRLRNGQGRDYLLRTINKDPAQERLRGVNRVEASNLLEDQLAAQHPYGALVLPRLSEAAGVFHLNPRLVYVPQDPGLGYYLPDFSNAVALLEENPDSDHPAVRELAANRNLIGTDRLFERLRAQQDATVDQPAYARARLFDMLIGDWDRHEGQWRWVEQVADGRTRFLPVPKDRDMAFFKGTDGLLPYLASRRWAVRSLQGFGPNFTDIMGLNLTALSLDRTLLPALTLAEWQGIAREVQTALTDEVIEAAIREWPPEVFAVSGPETIAHLKSRRDQLAQAAADYYRYLARVVEVAGTDAREHFAVRRLSDLETEVVVQTLDEDWNPARELYRRTLNTRETEEVRLYGLGGDDTFTITGSVGVGILVRIIGGEGNDVITDDSRVAGPNRKTYVYDTRAGNTFAFGPETRDRTADYREVNNYDRRDHRIPYLGPRLFTEYNVDDQLRLGVGLTLQAHAFRRSPFALQQIFRVHYALGTEAHSLEYDGTLTDAFGRSDLNLQVYQEGPQFLYNYFGQGNETGQVAEDIHFYRVRFGRLEISPTVSHDFASFFKVGVGPRYGQYLVERTADRFIATSAADVDPGTFGTTHYLGFRAFANVDAQNDLVNPRLGIKFLNEAFYNRQLGQARWDYLNLNSQFVFYLTPNLPFRATLAFRVGGAHTFGDYRFFQANTLGGTDNLRGYRRTRFAGRSNLYQNTELRVQLLRSNVFALPLNMGVTGLADFGRVFADGTHSSRLHHGFGGGIWVDFLNQTLLNATYTVGEEQGYVNLTFGFFF